MLIPDAKFDAVVMLTMSDWHNELRSNRYHYATRFAKIYPVIFVQPDLEEETYKFEQINVDNLVILHIGKKYNQLQSELLNKALFEKNICRPIYWVYNAHFYNYLSKLYSPFIIYHATEDYLLSKKYRYTKGSLLYDELLGMTKIISLLISVTEGVEEGFTSIAKYTGNKMVVTNGCDYKFYSQNPNCKTTIKSQHKNVIFYQGNIFNKLNFSLLIKLAKKLHDWEFWFCGRVLAENCKWSELRSCKNVKYFGVVSPEKIREYAYQATVGIIPFVENDYFINRSLPLKAFEYLACGLPVITTPIRSLLSYSEVFYFAKTLDEFILFSNLSSESRHDPIATRKRLEAAKLQDYDLKFEEVCKKILSSSKVKPQNTSFINQTKNILMLYDPKSIDLDNYRYELLSFYKNSAHKISYLSISEEFIKAIDLSTFQTIIFHDAIKFDVKVLGKFSKYIIEAFQGFSGCKVLSINDDNEIENYLLTLETFGFHVIMSPKQINVHKAIDFWYIPEISVFDSYINQL